MAMCPYCLGEGKITKWVEIAKDENSTTVQQQRTICEECDGTGVKALTKADIIRMMNDEELARQLSNATIGGMLGVMEAHGLKTSEEVKQRMVENMIPKLLATLREPANSGEGGENHGE